MPLNKNALIRYLAIDRLLREVRHATVQDIRRAIIYALEESRAIENPSDKDGNEDDELEEITISDRTIANDIKTMRYDRGLNWAAPIMTNRDDSTYYYDPNFKNYSIWENNLLNDERLALHLAAKIMNAFRGTQIWLSFSELFRRITRTERSSPDFNQYIPYKYFRFDNETEPFTPISTIVKSIFNEVIELEISESDVQNTKKTIIHPYQIEYSDGSWILTGYSPEEKRIKRIGISSIINVYSRPEMQFEKRPF